MILSGGLKLALLTLFKIIMNQKNFRSGMTSWKPKKELWIICSEMTQIYFPKIPQIEIKFLLNVNCSVF